MANYFKMLKPAQAMLLDKVLFAVGGIVHLLPNLAIVKTVAEFALGPISVQMVVGALMVARFVDMMMK